MNIRVIRPSARLSVQPDDSQSWSNRCVAMASSSICAAAGRLTSRKATRTSEIVRRDADIVYDLRPRLNASYTRKILIVNYRMEKYSMRIY